MRKWITILTLLLALAMPSVLLGATAGSCTETKYDLTSPGGSSFGSIKVVTFTCTAGDGGASPAAVTFSDSAMSFIRGFYLYKVISNPGSTAPAASWDFTITDGDGIDLLNTGGTGRSATASESIYPLISSQPFAQPIIDTLYLTITNMTNANSGVVVKAIFVR